MKDKVEAEGKKEVYMRDKQIYISIVENARDQLGLIKLNRSLKLQITHSS